MSVATFSPHLSHDAQESAEPNATNPRLLAQKIADFAAHIYAEVQAMPGPLYYSQSPASAPAGWFSADAVLEASAVLQRQLMTDSLLDWLLSSVHSVEHTQRLLTSCAHSVPLVWGPTPYFLLALCRLRVLQHVRPALEWQPG